MNNSLYFRKDNRSEEVFASNIYDYTQRESIYGECLRIEFENRMKVKVILSENGIDNSGNLTRARFINVVSNDINTDRYNDIILTGGSNLELVTVKVKLNFIYIISWFFICRHF